MSVTRTVLAFAALAFASPAWALTCDEIMSMVGFDIPTHIIVQTMEGSGSRFTADDVRCLTDRQAPADIVDTARKMAGAADAEPEPAPSPRPVAPEPEPEETVEDPFEAVEEGPDVTTGTQEEEDEVTGPERVEELVRLYRAKKLLTSSKGFYDLLTDNTYPDYEDKIQYYLAKSLYDLGMYHGAQHYFMEVVRKGPSRPYFKYALPKMVAIAELTGDDTELLRIVHKIPAEAFPRQAKSHLYYLMGRKLYENEELAASARYFQQITPRSELYVRSKYFEGVIHHERGKDKSAVKAFRDVYQAEVDLADARQGQEVEDLRQLALIDIARIYYSLDRWDQADEFYSLVDRESTYWPQSLFERAWAQFRVNDLNGTLGLLLTTQSPHYSEEEFLPEATLLRALTFFQLCEYDDATSVLLTFESSYKPMSVEMKAFLDQYSSEEGQKLSDQAYEAYFERAHPSSKLDKALFLKLLKNRDLAALIRHMDQMDSEVGLIDAQKGAWKDSIGGKILEVIEEDRLRYKKRAGLILLQEMADQYAYLQDLIGQSELIRFEVVDAQRVDYEYKMTNPIVESESSRVVDWATSKTVIYWPFNGEFWKDELGYYRYTETPTCK